ncbi:MAG: NAD(P)/FAD-dependent oxidoreductase [Solirubrobacteraceae bacterium]|nr:NAD(P)/FAD-dependent oxidoreductase [Solirubrobacteraceae bacterium]
MIHHTSPHQDLDEVRDVTIIGAGPVGLAAGFWAGMREASSRIVDSLPQVGGQLITLYPEKWIFDVPGIPRILAKDLVEAHRRQTLEQFDVPVHLETTALSISWEGEGSDRLVVLHTDRGDLRSRALLVAGGHGAFEPKRLPGFDMAPWEGRGAHYIVSSKQELAGRSVLIVGGGDSALDWTINLLDTAERVALVHRRERFRAHEATVSQVMNAVGSGDVDLHVPFQIKEIEGSSGIERVTLYHSSDPEVEVDIECDAVLLQLGFKTALGPLADWGFDLEKGAIRVSPTFATSLERVWACGDITTFEGKLKLIATGYAEAAIAMAQAIHEIRPETKIQPKYSTNTGVPGAIVGQP